MQRTLAHSTARGIAHACPKGMWREKIAWRLREAMKWIGFKTFTLWVNPTLDPPYLRAKRWPAGQLDKRVWLQIALVLLATALFGRAQ